MSLLFENEGNFEKGFFFVELRKKECANSAIPPFFTRNTINYSHTTEVSRTSVAEAAVGGLSMSAAHGQQVLLHLRESFENFCFHLSPFPLSVSSHSSCCIRLLK